MISMVAAMARNKVIGNQGHLPWGHDMPSDAERYAGLIRGQTIVMGTNTFSEADHVRSESKIVVLSRKNVSLPEEISMVHSVEDVLALSNPDEELFITGGAGVFHLMLEHANKIYLTVIDQEFEGDVFFPEVDQNLWELTTKQDFGKDHRNKYDYSFLTYVNDTGVVGN